MDALYSDGYRIWTDGAIIIDGGEYICSVTSMNEDVKALIFALYNDSSTPTSVLDVLLLEDDENGELIFLDTNGIEVLRFTEEVGVIPVIHSALPVDLIGRLILSIRIVLPDGFFNSVAVGEDKMDIIPSKTHSRRVGFGQSVEQSANQSAHSIGHEEMHQPGLKKSSRNHERSLDIQSGCIYVNQEIGRDLFSGRCSRRMSSLSVDGPKQSIQAGLSVVAAGSSLRIASGGYREPLDVRGRHVTVHVDGIVNLRNR